MTIEELTKFASDFLKDNYGLRLEIPIVINNRLRRALGRYIRNEDNNPHSIEIAGYLLEYGVELSIKDTLYHECVHYALHTLGEPFRDGHPRFESELKARGVGATDTSLVGKYYHYNCEKCGYEAFTKRASVMNHSSRFQTSCCRANLVNFREVIYDGTEAVS